jgi:myosin-5
VFPETEDDFLSLEFPARCAIAGIQMDKTKVFLRREAFDRIESMRSERVSVAAAIIQARARGVLTRQYFGELMAAILCIQSVARIKIKRVKRFKACLASAITIQRTYRRYSLKKRMKAIPYQDLKDKRRRCAIQI